MGNAAELEDAALRRILLVSLRPGSDGSQSSPPTVHLGQLAEVRDEAASCASSADLLQTTRRPPTIAPARQNARVPLRWPSSPAGSPQELAQDAGGGAVDLMLNKALLDRVIVSRLIENPPEPYPQLPFHYLLGCYARASQELRSISLGWPAEVQRQLQEAVFAARELVVSYAGLVFMGGVVPEVRGGGVPPWACGPPPPCGGAPCLCCCARWAPGSSLLPQTNPHPHRPSGAWSGRRRAVPPAAAPPSPGTLQPASPGAAASRRRIRCSRGRLPCPAAPTPAPCRRLHCRSRWRRSRAARCSCWTQSTRATAPPLRGACRSRPASSRSSPQGMRARRCRGPSRPWVGGGGSIREQRRLRLRPAPAASAAGTACSALGARRPDRHGCTGTPGLTAASTARRAVQRCCQASAT
jgi:hypothetical protein